MRHDGEGIGIHLFENFAESHDLPAVDDADEHGMGFAGIHARGGDRGDASAQFGDNGEGHFIGLVRDDAEFDGGVESVGDGVVGFAFDVLFARGHNEGKNFADGIVCEVLVDEEGRGDDDAVEHEYHPSDGGSGAFSLDHDGDDIHAARASADFECEAYAGADADTTGQSGENFLVKDEFRHAEPLHEHEEQSL